MKKHNIPLFKPLCLALALGISYPAIAAIETGTAKPTMTTAALTADEIEKIIDDALALIKEQEKVIKRNKHVLENKEAIKERQAAVIARKEALIAKKELLIADKEILVTKQQDKLAELIPWIERIQAAITRIETNLLNTSPAALAKEARRRAKLVQLNEQLDKLLPRKNNADAALAAAQARIETAQAAITQAQAAIVAAQTTIDQAQAAIVAAQAAIVAAQAAITQARAAIEAAGGTVPTPESPWDLVWSDEFDGDAIDPDKWTLEVDCSGGGNQEKQCYTDNPENAFVEEGILKIVAQQASNQPLPFSSARLNSKNKGDWTYGRFEIRAKSVTGQGSWPAIWMLPTDEVYGGWPHSGELDIFESVNLGVPLKDDSGADTGAVETSVFGTLHYGRSWPNNDHSGHGYRLPDEQNPADDFHVYAVEWEEGEIRWYVDGVLYETQLKSEVNIDLDGDANGLLHKGWYTEVDDEMVWSNAPYDQRFHLILNLAVGGSWPENTHDGGVDATAFNASNALEIDYVRVYECSISPATGWGCATDAPGYRDPVADGGTLIKGEAPLPVKPSNGIARDLIVFEEAINEGWPSFIGEGGTATVESDDAAHGQVVEFTIGAAPMVAGFGIAEAPIPVPYDGSPMSKSGVLAFDLKVVTPAGDATTPWFLKIEQSGQTSQAELPVVPGATGEWQHFAIPLRWLKDKGLNLNGIDTMMMFPAWGRGEGAVYRIDNLTIKQGEAPAATGTALIDFENAADTYTFSDFDGGVAAVIDNPVTTGNASAQVVQMQKFAGQPWGGSKLALDNPVDIPAGTVVSMKVWSERQAEILLKLEGPDNKEVASSVTHDGNGWEVLSFDYADAAHTGLNAATLIVDLGTQGDAAADADNWTFYFDDMMLPQVGGGTGGNTPSDVPTVDFETEGGAYSWQTFENVDNPALEIVANPFAGGINNSATVAKFTARAAGQPWAGTQSAHGDFGPLTLDASNSIVKIMVYKSVISDVGIKFAIASNGAQPEIKVANTLINQWEELTFDFSGQIGTVESINIDQLIVFPDFGARGQDNVVYFDSISFSGSGGGSGGGTGGGTDGGTGGGTGGGSGGDTPSNVATVDFETEGDAYSWETFENVDNPALEIVANPFAGGINDSATVAKFTARAAGQPWAGSQSAHGDFGPLTLDASNSTVKIMVYKSVISDVGIKFAIVSNGAQPEIKVANTLINQWEELTFDFSGQIGTVESINIDQLIVFPDFGARGQDNVVYFDNISFSGSGDGSGTGGGTDGGTGGGTGGGSGDELVVNGTFDNGIDHWSAGIVNTEAGNSFYQADVAAPGNPWDVNLSQVMTLTQGETYHLTFRAKASVGRNIIAGLGLNFAPWTNATVEAALTT